MMDDSTELGYSVHILMEALLGAPRFSRRTVLAAIQVLECLTHAELTRFLHELGPEFSQLVEDDSQSRKKRLNSFMEIYDKNPNHRVDGGESIQDAIVEQAAALVRGDAMSWEDDAPQWVSDQKEFCRRLETDGFVISEGKVRAALPDDVGLPIVHDELRRLLAKHKFAKASGHLDQALEAHAKGNWASANSQIRAFLDALLDGICERIDPNTKSMGSGQPRRTQLAARGFFSRELNEWDDNGSGFVNGLVKRLHPHGAHPGLSNQADSTFRLHIVLLTARLFFTRFDTWGNP
jgi:hypothetical protein